MRSATITSSSACAPQSENWIYHHRIPLFGHKWDQTIFWSALEIRSPLGLLILYCAFALSTPDFRRASIRSSHLLLPIRCDRQFDRKGTLRSSRWEISPPKRPKSRMPHFPRTDLCSRFDLPGFFWLLDGSLHLPQNELKPTLEVFVALRAKGLGPLQDNLALRQRENILFAPGRNRQSPHK